MNDNGWDRFFRIFLGTQTTLKWRELFSCHRLVWCIKSQFPSPNISWTIVSGKMEVGGLATQRAMDELGMPEALLAPLEEEEVPVTFLQASVWAEGRTGTNLLIQVREIFSTFSAPCVPPFAHLIYSLPLLHEPWCLLLQFCQGDRIGSLLSLSTSLARYLPRNTSPVSAPSVFMH